MKIDDDVYRPLRRGHPRDHPPGVAVGRRQPLRRPAARRRATRPRRSPTGGVIGAGRDDDGGRPRPAVQHVRPADAQGAQRPDPRRRTTSTRAAAKQAGAGWAYLNPALCGLRPPVPGAQRDTPLLQRFVGATASLVDDVAQRRTQLAGLVDHLSTTTAALGAPERRARPARSASCPTSCAGRTRRSSTSARRSTTLDAARRRSPSRSRKKLRPFFAELRPLARDARPTLRDLSQTIQAPGRGQRPDRAHAARPSRCATSPSAPAPRDGAVREGALPGDDEGARAARRPSSRTARPYAPDLTGWFDDFSHSGHLRRARRREPRRPVRRTRSRTSTASSAAARPRRRRRKALDASGLSTGQRDRCPGAAERGATRTSRRPTSTCDASEGPLGK